LDLPEMVGEGKGKERNAGGEGRKDNGLAVGEARRHESRTKKRDAVPQRDEKEERARLSMIQVEVLLEGRQERSEGDSGEKVEEEDHGEENDGAYLAAKGGGAILLLLSRLAGYANRRHGLSFREESDATVRSVLDGSRSP